MGAIADRFKARIQELKRLDEEYLKEAETLLSDLKALLKAIDAALPEDE